MKLTKEECEKELKSSTYLSVAIVNGDGIDVWSKDFEQTTTYKVFKQLIEEHFKLVEDVKVASEYYDRLFSNKPYTFEDLKPNMWVWDNKEEIYCQIEGKSPFDRLSVNYHYESLLEFEPNRFYPRQVEV